MLNKHCSSAAIGYAKKFFQSWHPKSKTSYSKRERIFWKISWILWSKTDISLFSFFSKMDMKSKSNKWFCRFFLKPKCYELTLSTMYTILHGIFETLDTSGLLKQILNNLSIWKIQRTTGISKNS